jgi:hydroxymethylglutaryl-CoA lyase
MLDMYAAHDVPIQRATITAAFGCNFEGDIPTSRIIERVGQVLSLAQDHGVSPEWVSLADTMAWATPLSVRRVVGAVREHYPDLKLSLHLHDTRGMGIACAYAGLEMGVGRYDAAVGGLGGCPFAGHKGAAGNVSTEDLVFMCDEMGIETGIDLNTLTDCAALAEEIVGHPLPGAVMKGGSLQRLREQLAAGA